MLSLDKPILSLVPYLPVSTLGRGKTEGRGIEKEGKWKGKWCRHHHTVKEELLMKK